MNKKGTFEPDIKHGLTAPKEKSPIIYRLVQLVVGFLILPIIIDTMDKLLRAENKDDIELDNDE